MRLTFGVPVHVTSIDSIPSLARHQALECWRLRGAGYATVDEMVGKVTLRWYSVSRESGAPFADYWEVEGSALVFCAGTAAVLGLVSERGWACFSHPGTWERLSAARDAPPLLVAVARSLAVERARARGDGGSHGVHESGRGVHESAGHGLTEGPRGASAR